MSGIRKTRENYIAGRYYSPVIKQFLSPVNPETVLADALSAYGLNLYSLCLTNPVNLAYNEYTIEPGVELTYTPPALSAWDLFWRRPIAKVLAVTLFCFATLLAILNPAFLPLYFETLAGIATSLLMGATIAGLQARENGDPFWQSFGNYLNENWAQTLAISMAVFIIICGVSLAYHAFSSLRGKQIGKHQNIVGTSHSDLKPTQDEIRIADVERYVNSIKAGEVLKPIEVYDVPGKGTFIADGHHRYVASKLMGIQPNISYLPIGGPVGFPDWTSVRYVTEFTIW